MINVQLVSEAFPAVEVCERSVYEVEPSRVPGVVNVVKPVLAPPVRKEKSRARSAPGAVKIFVSRNSPGGTKSKVTDVKLDSGRGSTIRDAPARQTHRA